VWSDGHSSVDAASLSLLLTLTTRDDEAFELNLSRCVCHVCDSRGVAACLGWEGVSTLGSRALLTGCSACVLSVSSVVSLQTARQHCVSARSRPHFDSELTTAANC
jgi:hypothetical protein